MPSDCPRLAISDTDLERAQRHAVHAYPNECCGILIGATETKRHKVLEVRSATNGMPVGEQQDRYLISSAVVARAIHEAKKLNRDVVGYYHSHPNHPARPSSVDLELAWPNTSYLILSVADGQLHETRSWRLSGDRSSFQEEQIEGLNSAGKETL